MVRVISYIIPFLFLLYSCQEKSNNQKRKEVISTFFKAVKDGDTTKLYELIDTASYFRIQDNERLLFYVEYLKVRLKVCGSVSLDNVIIAEVPVYSKQYTVPLCRGQNGEVLQNSFDMLFTFANYEKDQKIIYLDLIRSRQDDTPTLPIDN